MVIRERSQRARETSGHLGPSFAHGKSDVSAQKSRSIVRPITGDSDGLWTTRFALLATSSARPYRLPPRNSRLSLLSPSLAHPIVFLVPLPPRLPP
eukprot:762480-Hanusia_phi.AAC.4